MNNWKGLHAYLFREPDEVDDLLTAHIAPILDREQEQGAISQWYFLRYWTGGPHLRLRVRDVANDDLLRIGREIEELALQRSEPTPQIDPIEYFAAFGRDGVGGSLREDGEVLIVAYEPEVDRYGGPCAIDFAESLFVASSDVAKAVISSTLGRLERRHAIAFDLLLVFMQAVKWSVTEAVQQARNYCFGWDLSAETSPLRPRWLVGEARTTYGRAPQRWSSRWSIIADHLTSKDDDAYTVWSSRIHRYVEDLHRAEVSVSSVNRATWSQMHMMMNRLGISVADEQKLVWLAALSIEAAALEGSVTSEPVLRYLASTRPPTSIQAGPPLVEVSQLAAPPSKPIQLSDSVPESALRKTLLSRRSITSGYRPALTIGQLSTVLGSISGPGGRTHPSPGGLNPTDVYVYARNMPGLTNGTYLHHGEDARLRPLGVFLDDSDFIAASPYLNFDGEPANSVSGAQVVFALVTEMPRLTPKYGPLALKLGLLDAGHLSQVLVTAAAELGLGTLVVGGFDEDALNASFRLDGINRFIAQLIVLGAR